MNIKWNAQSIHDLFEVVIYFKKNKIGHILECLGDYFIKKHLKHMSIKNYTMDFANETSVKEDIKIYDITMIKDAEYKLAFICEIASLYYVSFDKNFEKSSKNPTRHENRFKNVYKCIEYMIKYCICKHKSYFSNTQKPDFIGSYLTNVLRDILIPGKKIEKESPYFNILYFSYFLVLEIIKSEKRNPTIVYNLTSLITETQFLDLSILPTNIRRNLHDILKTKKTLYIRFLLILTNELLKNKHVFDQEWLTEQIRFNTKEKFIEIISSPLVETIIFLTSERIKK